MAAGASTLTEFLLRASWTTPATPRCRTRRRLRADPDQVTALNATGGSAGGLGLSVDGSHDVGSLLNWAENLQAPDASW